MRLREIMVKITTKIIPRLATANEGNSSCDMNAGKVVVVDDNDDDGNK